jgi:hypothetical protein
MKRRNMHNNMKSTNMQNIALAGQIAPTTNFRQLRKLFGLAISVIGLSASIMSAQANTIPVVNGNFETEFGLNTDPTVDWVPLTGWTFENTTTALVPIAGKFSSDPDSGSSFTRFTWNDAGVEQNLNTTVSAGDTLSVTFNLGVSLGAWDQDASRVKGNAYFKVGSTYYKMPYDLTGQTVGVWHPFTFTTTIINSGNLSIGFQNLNIANNYYTSLDGVSSVTQTPAVADPNAPSSTNATLAALENTATALAAGDLGYSDPNSSALANLQITSLPLLGTLKSNGTAVVSGDLPLTVAAANIGDLTYLSPLRGYGTPYTAFGIKVQNATGHWSLPAEMTVNVTHVNHAPTSTGGSVITRIDTVKTFAAADFQFSDVDTGDTLQAVQVTSLPTHGILNLTGVAVSSNQVVVVSDIQAGNLTYTPNTGYTGPDSFKFQVSDGALNSANATMAITVTSDILVQNGSFEQPGGINNATYWWSLGSPWTGGISPQGYEELDMRGWGGATFSSAADGFFAANLETWVISITQDLLTSVTAGDTLSVTFYGGRAKGQTGGKFTATFMVDATEYTSSVIDTTLLAEDTWQSYTFATPISNTGNLSLKFSPVSGRPWLDKVSNVSVTPPGGLSSACDILTFGPGAVINETARTIAWTVPFGINPNGLAPTYTVSDLAIGAPVSSTSLDFSNPQTYTVTAQDAISKKTYTVTVTVAPASTACDMLSFGLPGNPGTLTDGTLERNIYLKVPAGTDVTALAPTYTISPLATCNRDNGGPTTYNFTTPQTYTVTAQDGISNKTYTVTVIVDGPPVLIGHWASGAETLADTSGYTPAGTHNGVAVGSNAGSLGWSTDVPAGFTGKSLDLTAGNVGVMIPNTATNDAGYRTTFDQGVNTRITVTSWVKGPGTPANDVVSKSGRTPRGWAIRANYFMVRNNGIGGDNAASALFSPTVFNNGAWHHVAVVFNGWGDLTAVNTNSTRKIYVDGVLQAESFGTKPWAMTLAGASHLTLGCNQDGPNLPDGPIDNFLGGKLYDVRIYNGALTASQIANIYNPAPPAVTITSITGPDVAGKFTIKGTSGTAGTVALLKSTNVAAPQPWGQVDSQSVAANTPFTFIVTPVQGETQAFFMLKQ